MKREIPSKFMGSLLIGVSAAAFMVSERSIREINATLAEVNGGRVSLELRIAVYFICMLAFVTGIALYLRSRKLSRERGS